MIRPNSWLCKPTTNIKITDSPGYQGKEFCCKISYMPEDELEHLRAILARVHEEPRKGKVVRAIKRRIAKGFLVTPKKVIIERVQQQESPKKDAA